MQKQSAPTMKDVAKEAGVALGTVSKVINQIPVGEEYKQKVDAAITKLGYAVNTYARGLKTSKTGIITLIIPDTQNGFYASFANFVEAAVYKRGYKLMLCCSNGIPAKEIEYMNMATQSKTDAIVALTYLDIGNYISRDIPLVCFDRYFDNTAIPRIASDNYAGGALALQKLLEFGCRNPVFIRFHSSFPGEADKRRLGFVDACEANGIIPDCLDELDCPNYKEKIVDFIKAHQHPDGTLSFDGIFANTDFHAYQALILLQNMGYKVPEDVQIIGFDGLHKFGDLQEDLYVSSICQPIRELAAKCVELVLNENQELPPSLTLLPVHYKNGGTTKDLSAK